MITVQTHGQLFKLTFTYAEWQALVVTEKYKWSDEQSNKWRTYYVLKQDERVHVFYEHFFSITKLPSPIAFKRNKMYPCGNKFLQFEGECPECDSKLKRFVYDKPEISS